MTVKPFHCAFYSGGICKKDFLGLLYMTDSIKVRLVNFYNRTAIDG